MISSKPRWEASSPLDTNCPSIYCIGLGWEWARPKKPDAVAKQFFFKSAALTSVFTHYYIGKTQ